MKTLVLVAGHALGGDPGAVGQGTFEAQETVQIVDRIANILLPHPEIEVMVVPHNLDYVDSTNWINQRVQWDESDTIVVEIHLNAPAVASGTETIVAQGGLDYPEIRRLAQTIQNAVVDKLHLPNRGIKQQPLYLMANVNPLSCLVEVRFIGVDDNSDHADQLAAEGTANGICDFFRVARPGAAPAPQPAPALKPTPTPEKKPDVLYHVLKDGKQIGAYASDKNAYGVWRSNKGAIIRDGAGNDVTGKLVEKYGEKVSIPTPITPIEPADYQEVKRRVSALEAVVKVITDFLSSIFNGFKK